MTDDGPSHDSPPAHGSVLRKAGLLLWRCFLWLILGFLVLLIVGAFIQPIEILLEVPLRLVAGWILYLWRNLPQVRWSPEMVTSAGVAVLLASVSLHALARRLCPCAKDTAKPAWSWRSTLALTVSVAVLFGSAMCGTGIVHQLGWLMRTDWITDGRFGRDVNQARQLVTAAKMYAHDNNGHLPARLEDMQDIVEPAALAGLLLPHAEAGEVSEPWIYLGAGLPTGAPGWLPVMVQPRPWQRRRQNMRIVYTLDGASAPMSDEDYQALLSRRRAYLQQQKQQP